jgi:hypothetical protein
MKTRLLIDVGDYERYVIARYFAVAPTSARDQRRPRATRAQVKRFVQAALRTAVREQVTQLRQRQRTTAARLAEGRSVAAPEELVDPPEKQPSLAW